MTITANVVDGVLTVAGESEAAGDRYLYVNSFAEVVDGLPNLLDPDLPGFPDEVFFLVPVDDDGSDIVKIDATGVTGAGVEVEVYEDGVEILGSEQDDIVIALGDAIEIETNGGDDLILAASGFGGAQSIDGGAGADTIYAGDGDDVLIGGAGADIISGEEGFDVVAYSGARSDYEITVENGAYLVRDLREGAPDGADRIADVEQLRFADQTIDLTPLASALVATVADSVLALSGEALSGGSLGFASDRVYVVSDFSQLTVRDGGDLHPIVPLASDDWSPVRVIDARGVLGVGVDVFAAAQALRVFGSEQSDVIVGLVPPSSGPRAVLLGHGGDDTITGDGEGRLYLGGGDGDDSLTSSEGADTLIGNRGDDTLDGGDGFDIALYSGAASDYVVAFQNGAYTVTDLRAGRDGVDVLHGVERLQFDDGEMSLDDMEPPTDLEATLSQGVLTVSGVAASIDDLVLIHADDLRVRDNGDPRAEIAIDDDATTARTVDARGVTVGGVDVTTNIKSARVFGSEQGDYIEIGGAGRNVVMGGGGGDSIEGYSGRDELNGGDGDDLLFGDFGADILTGGRGDDTLDGGSGADVAAYSGARSNYLIEQIYDYYRVTDLRAGYNGTDLIVDVEQLRFKDGLFDVDTLVAPPPAEDALIA